MRFFMFFSFLFTALTGCAPLTAPPVYETHLEFGASEAYRTAEGRFDLMIEFEAYILNPDGNICSLCRFRQLMLEITRPDWIADTGLTPVSRLTEGVQDLENTVNDPTWFITTSRPNIVVIENLYEDTYFGSFIIPSVDPTIWGISDELTVNIYYDDSTTIIETPDGIRGDMWIHAPGYNILAPDYDVGDGEEWYTYLSD